MDNSIANVTNTLRPVYFEDSTEDHAAMSPQERKTRTAVAQNCENTNANTIRRKATPKPIFKTRVARKPATS
ncbi:hypothetical protein NX059_002387 [Plenodomus lindquistii]|nr:hypothetical protein NX059_002387 [Plenodomus lindquistii]